MAPAVRLLLLFAGAPAALLHAESLSVANPSFEDFYIGPGAYRTGEITGWSQDGGGRGHVGIQSAAPGLFALAPTAEGEAAKLPPPAEGLQFAFINTPTDGAQILLYQVLGPLRPRTRYTFTVAVGNRLDKGHLDKILLELRNGDTPVAPVLASASNAAAPANGTFADHSVSFETGRDVAGNLLVGIRNQTGVQLVFDHVRVTAETIGAAPR